MLPNWATKAVDTKQEGDRMPYLLMNKDHIVAEIQETAGVVSEEPILSLDNVSGKLPIGMTGFETWLSARQASKHNSHLQRLMTSLGCNTKEGFISVTHAASINDTFWVKKDTETISWKDVSLYANEFTEIISKLAFEPYCEAMASEISEIICPGNSVQYEFVDLHGKLASRCNLFTDEENGYVSIAKVFRNTEMNADNVLQYFSSIGFEEQFRAMVVTDSVCFNLDRYAGNYGILFDNDTLQIERMAPVFDFNLSSIL